MSSLLTAIEYANGTKEALSYDKAGNLTAITDAMGSKTSYTYDAVGRMTTTTDALGNVTEYAYDAADNLTAVTDALGHITEYTYDANGNLTSETDAIGNTVKYTYTPEGWLKSVTDAEGKVTKYSYDKTGNIISEDYAGEQTTENTYNEIGRLTTVTTDEGETTYQYDDRGNLISVTEPNGDTVSYIYDEQNRRQSITYPSGKTVSYTYDAMDRLTAVKGLDGTKTTYTYDANGNLVKKQSAGGAVSYAYNAMNLLQSWTDGEHTEDYTYNASGLLSTITTGDSTTTLTWDILYGDGVVISAAENGTVTNYDYGLERISALTGKSKTEYIYDGRGSVAAELSYNTAWYNLKGALSSVTVVTKSYTPFGEQIGKAVSGFGYNGEYYNAETGSIYLRARNYEPAINRFSQKDILRGAVLNPDSLNRYLYVQNDPLNFVDASGRSLRSFWTKTTSAISNAVKAVKTDPIGAIRTAAKAVSKGVVSAVTNPIGTAKKIVSSAASVVKEILTPDKPSNANNSTQISYPRNLTYQDSVQEDSGQEEAEQYSKEQINNRGGYTEDNMIAPRDYKTEGPKTYYCDKENDSINYIIYTTGTTVSKSDFTLQAVYQRNQYIAEGKNVVMIPVNTKEEFESAWNGMNGNINDVIILSHSNERSIILEEGSSSEALSVNGLNAKNKEIGNIANLQKKEIEALELLSCNAGHLDQAKIPEGNVAQAFVGLGGIEKVVAYDGNVGFGNDYNIITKAMSAISGELAPRESSDQVGFENIIKKLDAEPRNSSGQVTYYPDGNVAIGGW